MTPQEFCIWLKGHFEMNNNEVKHWTVSQVKLLKEKLDTVTDEDE